MDGGCYAALYEHELPAFALPAGLDRPPADFADLADLEGRRLDDSLSALDALGLNAPMDLDETAMLFADPTDSSSSSSSGWRPTPRCRAKHSGAGASAASPSRTHKLHHLSKKASRKQVHELQVIVNNMQTQVNGARAEIQQLAQLVGQFALQQQQQQRRQSLDEHEMSLDLDMQRRQLHVQVEFERQQLEQQQQQQYEDQEGRAPFPPVPLRFWTTRTETETPLA
ncbi:hypothetical protein PF008_g31768, partial [Phytophthora fragariae]